MPSADETYRISAETWDHYQQYLGKIDNGNKPGAYVITKDGYGAYHVWRDANRCRAGANVQPERAHAFQKARAPISSAEKRSMPMSRSI